MQFNNFNQLFIAINRHLIIFHIFKYYYRPGGLIAVWVTCDECLTIFACCKFMDNLSSRETVGKSKQEIIERYELNSKDVL